MSKVRQSKTQRGDPSAAVHNTTTPIDSDAFLNASFSSASNMGSPATTTATGTRASRSGGSNGNSNSKASAKAADPTTAMAMTVSAKGATLNATPIDDFRNSQVIDQPDSPMNRDTLPQTLQDCVGYLRGLPLVQPNANQRDPVTIVDMINISSLRDAKQILEDAMGLSPESEFALSPQEYRAAQLKAYRYDSEPMMSLLHRARRHTVHKSAPSWWLRYNLVQPGHIGLYNRYGIIYAVPEGRWTLFPDWDAFWLTNVSLNSGNCIRVGATRRNRDAEDLLIIRIIEGEVGFITEQGIHKLLDVGTHVFNSGTVKFSGVVRYASSDNHFQHGPYHYMNVPRGKYAQVWAEVVNPTDGIKSLVPRLLKEGEHCIKSAFFRYHTCVDVSAEYIGHGSVHIINVLKGHVAKIFHNNMPRLLGEGTHVIESPNFKFCGDITIVENPCIVHGTITIVQVPKGKIALVWNRNEPYFIDTPGIYEVNSEDFQFHEFVDCSERLIELGSKKIVQVFTGSVGITYDRGELIILKNGCHVIDSSTHIFERFLSTKQRSIRLVSHGKSAKVDQSMSSAARSKSSASKSSKDQFFPYANSAAGGTPDDTDAEGDLLVCETRDLVKVGVRADVFYSISDPEKCIRTLDTDQLEDLVRETAVSTLTNIIRSTALNQIAQSENVSASRTGTKDEVVVRAEAVAGSDDDPINEIQQAAALFFDRAHDEFMAKLHEDFIVRYGVDIANIRMESFKIMDRHLADQISQHVLTTAQTENELSNLKAQNMIQTQKERTQAQVAAINTDAEARTLKTRTDAENKRKIEAAQAEAEAIKIRAIAKAQAEADVILMKAKAEAEAIRLKADAESSRAKLLSETRLGQQECLLQIYSDMVKHSNEGVQKVVYMDPSIDRNSPFALSDLDTLNRDLHALSRLGIASSNGTNHPMSSSSERTTQQRPRSNGNKPEMT